MISLLVPSRGRRDALRELLVSVWATTTALNEVVVRIDKDDPDRLEYKLLVDEANERREWVKLVEGERSTLSGLWNECAVAADGSIFMQCADDIRFRTPGWPKIVTSAFREHPDKIAYVYGRDGIADERMATHGFMHRRWYEALGYFTWPEFSSDYGDLWNHTIAEKLGRLHYIPELYTEHLHPSAGKGEWDQTHQERMERDSVDKNAARWEQAQPDLEKAVETLRKVMQ